MNKDILFNRLDKKSFLKDLHSMKERCLREVNYEPEPDIAYLITKYNLDSSLIWKKIRKYLEL